MSGHSIWSACQCTCVSSLSGLPWFLIQTCLRWNMFWNLWAMSWIHLGCGFSPVVLVWESCHTLAFEPRFAPEESERLHLSNDLSKSLMLCWAFCTIHVALCQILLSVCGNHLSHFWRWPLIHRAMCFLLDFLSITCWISLLAFEISSGMALAVSMLFRYSSRVLHHLVMTPLF